MRSSLIRSVFLDFFTERGHRRVPSGSLVPPDATLLLTNAGMVQFKAFYMGRAVPDFSRATTLQKCVRTVDLDNVGRTTRHGTFFEMLGNFAFGDYFKREAVAWAWELLTGPYGLDRRRLWVTVDSGDDETERLWRRLGVPGERVQRLDNYWSMGMAGARGAPPGGPQHPRPAKRGGGAPPPPPPRPLGLWGPPLFRGPARTGGPPSARRA